MKALSRMIWKSTSPDPPGHAKLFLRLRLGRGGSGGGNQMWAYLYICFDRVFSDCSDLFRVFRILRCLFSRFLICAIHKAYGFKNCWPLLKTCLIYSYASGLGKDIRVYHYRCMDMPAGKFLPYVL